jgi:hypothetical protein
VPPLPLRQPLACPPWDLRLLLTHDRQRDTSFTYWRCAREHGRLTTFFDFLREKDFVRPLSPPQLAELRANVKMINCPNCGAPIDLADASAGAHCGTPISILASRRSSGRSSNCVRPIRGSRTIDPTLPLGLEVEKHHVDALFETLGGDSANSGGFPPRRARLPRDLAAAQVDGPSRNARSAALVMRYSVPIFFLFKSPASRLAMTSDRLRGLCGTDELRQAGARAACRGVRHLLRDRPRDRQLRANSGDTCAALFEALRDLILFRPRTSTGAAL